MCSLRFLTILILTVSLSTASHLKTDPQPCTNYADPISNLITRFLEQLRSHMSEGIPSLGIPPLDPLQIQNETVRLKKLYEYDLSGGITNSNLRGLHEFNVTSISTSLLHMQANVSLTIPSLHLAGTYNLKGKALQIIPLRGKGPYTITPRNITASTYTTLHITHSHIQMKSIDFKVDIKSLEATFQGLFGGGTFEHIANKLMNRFGLSLYRRIEPKIHERIRVALLAEINEILKDIPISELTNMRLESCA